MGNESCSSCQEPHATRSRPAPNTDVPEVRGLKRGLYWFAAGFFFLLAMLGVVLPGIPTTPFLLLMCHFLIRVSPALHARALQWPVVGEPLRDWREQGGVRRNVKAFAITMVTLLVGFTLLFGSLPMIVKLIILCAALYGIYFVLRLPTAQCDKHSQTRDLPAPSADAAAVSES